mgnify:CR=1 FL=1
MRAPTCPLCGDCLATRWEDCTRLEATGLARPVARAMGSTRLDGYIRGYALADDERRRERRIWFAIALACVVAAYSAGRYVAAPRCRSCPPGAGAPLAQLSLPLASGPGHAGRGVVAHAGLPVRSAKRTTSARMPATVDASAADGMRPTSAPPRGLSTV